MKEAILKINSLSIGFKKPILENISAEVNRGSITALMGVNGVGKSCLIKTLTHLIPALSGSILLQGKPIEDYSPLEFSKVASIVLTEKFNVDFLRVDELVLLGRTPFTNWLGTIHPEDQVIVNEVMKLVGIENLSQKFFSELSDGQKQKVLIARALAQKPRLLILDEPTTYLDIPSKIELMKLLKKISTENNVAIILSTHDLELVEAVVDNIWLLGIDGSFISEGPEVLRSTGQFKKHFNI